MNEASQLVRVDETDRAPVHFEVDGRPATALEGDTLLTALLVHRRHVRHSEFGDGVRAGFCLMGACQDCWVWTDEGERLRACTTVIHDGLRIATRPPEATWPNLA